MLTASLTFTLRALLLGGEDNNNNRSGEKNKSSNKEGDKNSNKTIKCNTSIYYYNMPINQYPSYTNIVTTTRLSLFIGYYNLA